MGTLPALRGEKAVTPPAQLFREFPAVRVHYNTPPGVLNGATQSGTEQSFRFDIECSPEGLRTIEFLDWCVNHAYRVTSPRSGITLEITLPEGLQQIWSGGKPPFAWGSLRGSTAELSAFATWLERMRTGYFDPSASGDSS